MSIFKNDVLYHCIPVTPEGDTIRTSTLYSTEIPSTLREYFNQNAEVKIPLIFAATQMSKALSFGFHFSKGEAILYHSIETKGCNQELVIVCNRKEVMARERNVTVFAVPKEGFRSLTDEQWIFDKPISFSDCRIVYQAKTAEDIIRGGVQVFSVDESYEELKEGSFTQDLYAILAKKNFYEELGVWVKQGKIKWENKERNINIHPLFAKDLKIDIRKHIKKEKFSKSR